MPNTVSPTWMPSAIAAGRPYSFCQRSPSAPNSRCSTRAACTALPANCAGVPAVNAASSESFCTESSLPECSFTMRPPTEKNSFASASTLAASSTSDMRVKLRSSANSRAAGRRSVCMLISGYQAGPISSFLSTCPSPRSRDSERAEQGATHDEHHQRAGGEEAEVVPRWSAGPGPAGPSFDVVLVAHSEETLVLKFLKNSSATFFAAASTRREPICASLPPTFALAW